MNRQIIMYKREKQIEQLRNPQMSIARYMNRPTDRSTNEPRDGSTGRSTDQWNGQAILMDEAIDSSIERSID